MDNPSIIDAIGASPLNAQMMGSSAASFSDATPSRVDASNTGLGTREQSTIIMGTAGVGSDDEINARSIDLSNGIRMDFVHRKGWPQPVAAGSHKGHHNQAEGYLQGRRVTPFSDVVIDYELLKSIDMGSEVFAKLQKEQQASVGSDGSSSSSASPGSALSMSSLGRDRFGVKNAAGRSDVYHEFDFASELPLASRMVPGAVYESQKGFELKFIPSYTDCSAPIIYALNMALPYLREGDEVILFAPSYLGPSLANAQLGEAYRPKRRFDETKEAYEEPPIPPAANNECDEHSFIRISVKRVLPEIALTEDRYITKTVISEGKGNAAPSSAAPSPNKRLDLSHDQHHNYLRSVAVGSVVSFDIGEVNAFLNKPLRYRTVKDCVVAGGSATCDELDVVLLSMKEGEFSHAKIGSTCYHIKLLEIAAGTAAGEVFGDAATELARRLKDAGNSVLSAGANASTRQFLSPVRPSRNPTVMGSPNGSTSGGAFGTDQGADDDNLLTIESLAAKRYFPPPSDLTPNPILDALSTFIARPCRTSYLRCAKARSGANNGQPYASHYSLNNGQQQPSSSIAAGSSSTNPASASSTAAGASSASASSSHHRHVITKDSEPFSVKINDEATYRALQLYKYAQNILFDARGEYYGTEEDGDDADDNANSANNNSSSNKAAHRRAAYSLDKRAELLGTVHGNTAQVYLNLHFYDEAIHAASQAIERCAPHDSYKHYYRRSKALRARGLFKEAKEDLLTSRSVLVGMNVDKKDARYGELDREMLRCEEDERMSNL